ncbi:MAG: ATP-binding protein, partial [Lentisphaeria bacterium]
MNKTQHLNFRVSSGLKTIIGKELITNDFIAVFELVKNSFDAHAKRVNITFHGLTTDTPKLVIADNGKGMDHDDLLNKWLFVAYSAKKDGTEDYRDKIKSSRIHAGAKGIGRFSCDRLGSQLTIYTRRCGVAVGVQRLQVDWSQFERDLKEEFISIPVTYTEVESCPYDLQTGTVLEIEGLRDAWDRAKLLDLKHSLERLINPNQDNDPDGFSIYLNAPDETLADKEAPSDEPWNRVNGKIDNFIFENLGCRTTQITTRINAEGTQIHTRLEDRGTLIYDLVERNDITIGKTRLADISVRLFFLNHPAKLHFAHTMGVTTRDYGSVFLYKNGFRVHPFGDVRDDRLGIDRRKQQGTMRYLGTRDLSGRIEIHGDNPAFQETSSRDGGLVQDNAFVALRNFFFDYTLKRLERFVIDVAHFGGGEDLLGQGKRLSADEIKERVLEIVAKLTSAQNVIAVDYDTKFFDIMQSRSTESLGALLRNFKRMAAESNNDTLLKEAKKAEKRYKAIKAAKDEAESERDAAEADARKAQAEAKAAAEEAERARRDAEDAQKETRQRATQNIFLKSIVSRDMEHVLHLHHHITISAHTIEQCALNVARKINNDKPLSKDYLLIFINRIIRQVKTISTITRFATKAQFNVEAVTATEDLVAFIQEYIGNVCAGLYTTAQEKPLEFQVKVVPRLTHVTEF